VQAAASLEAARGTRREEQMEAELAEARAAAAALETREAAARVAHAAVEGELREARAAAAEAEERARGTPPPFLPPFVLIGHAASLTPY